MAIWVIKDGQREGPYEEQDIRELVYEGTYGDADPAIRDGQYDWTTVGSILGRDMPRFEMPSVAVAPLIDVQLEPPPMPAAPAPPAAPAAPPAPGVSPQPMPVTVVDFQMPFGSMVIFMIKWALAAIPAFLILGAVAAFFWGVCLALLAVLFHH